MTVSRPSSRVPKNHRIYLNFLSNKQKIQEPTEKYPRLKKQLEELPPPLANVIRPKRKAQEPVKNRVEDRLSFRMMR